MSSPFFRFKQFTVWHDRCAMKVGTDGVLLGAWAMLEEQCAAQTRKAIREVLDIGTGSGLVALMLAQRFPQAEIDAIDIEPSAVEQARYNFLQSPWKERVRSFLSPLQEWQTKKRYDLIVSNPPYFQNSLKNPDKGRELARHTDSLTYAELLHYSAQLLAPEGVIALILPAESEDDIIRLGISEHLSCTRLTRVYSKAGKPAKRILIEFSAAKLVAPSSPVIPSDFYIESPTSPRSPEYTALTSAFYL